MDLLHAYVLSYASANCMLAYMLLHRGICTFGAFYNSLYNECILATCTLCCYNPWFCCLHASIVLLLACFHSSACSVLLLGCFHGSVACMLPYSSAACMLQFCCLNASIVLLLPWFCSLRASFLLLACIHGSAPCILHFCCLLASMVLLLPCFHI